MTPPSELPIIPEAPMQTAVDVSKVATMNEEVQSEWVLVPKKPTEAMWRAWYSEAEIVPQGTVLRHVEAYQAMLGAAPASPSPSQQERGLEVSDEAVEAAARKIGLHTYARVFPHMADNVAWEDMDEADHKIYRSAARAALLAASSVSPATGVSVKPLAWVQRIAGSLIADTDFGHYRVDEAFQTPTAGGMKLVLATWWGPMSNAGQQCVDMDSARAAAQADFDRRVRSCLAPQPSSTDSAWQDIATAPKDGTEVIVFDPQNTPPVFTSAFVKWWACSCEDRYVPQDDYFGDVPKNPTHWQPLPIPPKATP